MNQNAHPTFRVLTPSPLWAVLFLRDAWQLSVLADIPQCEPRPGFAVTAGRPATKHDIAMLEATWWELMQPEGLEPVVEGREHVYRAIREIGEVDAWRAWSTHQKQRVERLATPLRSSPFWLVGPDIALHRPEIAEVVVLPVTDHYVEAMGNILVVALEVCADARLLRRAIAGT